MESDRRSPGPAPQTKAGVGTLEESQDRDFNFIASSTPRAEKPVQGQKRLQVPGGIKNQWKTHSRLHFPAGTVVTVWDSTREISEAGDIWR